VVGQSGWLSHLETTRVLLFLNFRLSRHLPLRHTAISYFISLPSCLQPPLPVSVTSSIIVSSLPTAAFSLRECNQNICFREGKNAKEGCLSVSRCGPRESWLTYPHVWPESPQ